MKIHFKAIKAIITCCLLNILIYQSTLIAESRDNSSINITDSTSSLVITESVSILEDQGGNLTLDDVLSVQVDKQFQPHGKEFSDPGYKKGVYWIKFTLSNKTEEAQRLVLVYGLNRAGMGIDLYVTDGKKQIMEMTNDRSSSFFQEAISHRFVTFPLLLKESETLIFYSRITNKTYLGLDLLLYSESSFKHSFKNDYVFFGSVFGIIFILIVYNLALYFSFKDTSYIYYIFLLIAFLIWHFVQEGVLFEVLPVLDPLGDLLYFSANLVMGIALLLFSRSFLKLSTLSPWVDKFTVGLMVLLALNIILCQLSDSSMFIISRNLLSAIAGLSMMVIGPLSYLKGYRPARFYMLATFFAIIPSILQIISVLDVFGFSVKTSFSSAVGAVFMVSMFSLGLMSRVNDTRREKEEAQKRLIEVLTSTEKLKDEFLANTSHELRTPLNGIIGIADSMIGGAAGQLARPIEDNLRLIVHSGKRLANLVNDILDFSRLKNKELRLYLKPVNMRQIVSLVIPFCKPLIKESSIAIKNTIGGDIPLVNGDEDRLQQIMYNIIGNAIKFTNEGDVTISATRSDDTVTVVVADTGIGIPADRLPTIFDEFVQVDASPTRQYEGAGIGLSITKRLIDLHNGTIWVESELEIGTTVSFTVPIVTESTIEEEPEKSDEKLSRLQLVSSEEISVLIPEPVVKEDRDGSLVLVVDDDPVNLTVMANQLSISNFQVLTACCGREALQIINGDKTPDLVLLDLMMPDMNGFEVMSEIRTQFSILDLPIIVVSARNRVVDFMKAIEVGGNDYISKPVNTGELLTRLKLHDEFRKQNRELNNYRLHLESMVDSRTAELNRSLENVEEAKRIAEQANAAKTEFLSNVSHDLRSPMQGILGFSRLGESRAETTNREKLENYFRHITESGDRLLGLLNNLLDLSKLEAGKIEFVFRNCPILKLVQHVTNDCYSLLSDKNLTLDIDNLEFEETVEMDADFISRVLHNLLSNAIKFSPEKGVIRVKPKKNGENFVLSIIDNGIGIPAEELETVFNRFEQSSVSGKEKGGTGLGLSICREIISGHNGRIWAEQNPEGGSIFTFSIPTRQST